MIAMSDDDVIKRVAQAALSDEERLGFLELCEGRSAEELLADRDRVRAHLRVVEAAAADGVFLLDDQAEKVATALIALLDGAGKWTFVERRLLAGAVEYFLRVDDVDGDLSSMHGLADDAKVVVAVCDALGRPELAVRLR